MRLIPPWPARQAGTEAREEEVLAQVIRTKCPVGKASFCFQFQAPHTRRDLMACTPTRACSRQAVVCLCVAVHCCENGRIKKESRSPVLVTELCEYWALREGQPSRRSAHLTARLPHLRDARVRCDWLCRAPL